MGELFSGHGGDRKALWPREIADYFEQPDLDSAMDPEIMEGAGAEDIEEVGDVLEENRRDRERRSWVKSMLLRTGS